MRTCSTRKRVLVTGGAGFFGAHLCERLLGAGEDVLCAERPHPCRAAAFCISCNAH